jgi:hypothetical protein
MALSWEQKAYAAASPLSGVNIYLKVNSKQSNTSTAAKTIRSTTTT